MEDFKFEQLDAEGKTSRPEETGGARMNSEQERVSEEYAETVPEFYKGTYLRAARRTASPRQAIKANCSFCVGYEEVRERVRSCRVLICPLWPYRPYQTAPAKTVDAIARAAPFKSRSII